MTREVRVRVLVRSRVDVRFTVGVRLGLGGNDSKQIAPFPSEVFFG